MGTNWVFVDYRVEDRAVLLAGLGADCEWRLVGPDEDGPRQIRAALDGQHDVASIRIIAHGRPGAILLGATEIDGGTLARRDGELAQIGQVLAAGGDLQLYACAVGDGEAGRVFVGVLAEGLGVPVAASSTPVGHADLGGDWRLDVGVRKPTDLPEFRWVNTILGNLKTSLSGCYHALEFRKYGDQCLAAFAYRFNRRFDLRTLNERLLIAAETFGPRRQRAIRAADVR